MSQDPGSRAISIVVPHRNHANYLISAIGCFERQTLAANEILIVDDASNDHNWEAVEMIAARSPTVRAIRLPQQKGVNGAVQVGLSEAAGDYVLVAGADDVIEPEYLETSAAVLDRFPETAFCFSEPGELSADGTRRRDYSLYLARQPREIGPDEIEALLRRAAFTFPTNTILYRRKALISVGGFDPELHWHADWFAAHALACRVGACFVPDNLAYFRVRADSYSGRALRRRKHRRAVVSAVLARLSGDFADVGARLRRAAVLPEYDLRLLPTLLGDRRFARFVTPRLIARIVTRQVWSLGRAAAPPPLRRWLRRSVMPRPS